MLGKWFNDDHPEAREGEVFLGNFDDEGLFHVGWHTKRKGSVAYDVTNKPVKYGLFPVFVQRTEMEKGGVNPDGMWDDINWKYRIRPLIYKIIAIVLVVATLITLIAIFWPK